MKLLHITLLLVPVFFASCVQKPLSDSLAKVSIKVNWDQVEDGNTDAVTIQIAGKSIQVTRDDLPDTVLVASGNYEVYAFNTPSGIVIKDNVAIMDTDKDGYIIPGAGVFYSTSASVTAGLNRIAEIELTPVRCMRRLTVVNTSPPNDTINSTTGLLSNVAQSFDIKTTKEKKADMAMLFFSNDTCHIDLFGVVGESQTVSLKMVTNRGIVKQSVVNVSESLSDFNTDKSLPKEIMIKP